MSGDRLREIVSTVLGIPAASITDALSRDTAEQWDSFNHLLLVSEIEKKMGITFTVAEVESIKTFKDVRGIVESRKK